MNSELAALVQRHLGAENAHDLPGTLATLHPECRFEDLATGQSWSGHDGAAAHYRQWWTTFDVTVQRSPGQHSVWSTEGFYMAEATWHGRHVGRFLDIEPTGRTIVQPFVVVLTFRDGLMLGERFHYDLASLLRQIGGEPLPALAAMPHRRAA
jgi:ketosteroid isomerase-like protein